MDVPDHAPVPQEILLQTPGPVRKKRRNKDEIAADKAQKERVRITKAAEKVAKAQAAVREKEAKTAEKDAEKQRKASLEKQWRDFDAADHREYTEREEGVIDRLPSPVEEGLADELYNVSISEDEAEYFADQPRLQIDPRQNQVSLFYSITHIR